MDDSKSEKTEEQVVEEITEQVMKKPRRFIIVSSSDNPMPIPSIFDVSEQPNRDNTEEWEKWRKNVNIQKAWSSKFPFLQEHYESIPVDHRIEAWRNRVEDSETINVRSTTHTEDIFEEDENIGNDIKGLFKEDSDIFDKDPNIGEDIKKLFEEPVDGNK